MILAPLPITLGGEDERYADDLPASAVYVHLDDTLARVELPHMPGLMALTGVLKLGSSAEVDGRRSNVRLLLEADSSSQLAEPPAPAVFSRFLNSLQRVEKPHVLPQ